MKLGIGTLFGFYYLISTIALSLFFPKTQIIGIEVIQPGGRTRQVAQLGTTQEEPRRLHRPPQFRVKFMVEKEGVKILGRLNLVIGILLGIGCLLLPFVRNFSAQVSSIFTAGVLLMVIAGREFLRALWMGGWYMLEIFPIIAGVGCFLLSPLARWLAMAYAVMRLAIIIFAGQSLQLSTVKGVGWVTALTGAEVLVYPLLILWFFTQDWVSQQFRPGGTR